MHIATATDIVNRGCLHVETAGQLRRFVRIVQLGVVWRDPCSSHFLSMPLRGLRLQMLVLEKSDSLFIQGFALSLLLWDLALGAR